MIQDEKMEKHDAFIHTRVRANDTTNICRYE